MDPFFLLIPKAQRVSKLKMQTFKKKLLYFWLQILLLILG